MNFRINDGTILSSYLNIVDVWRNEMSVFIYDNKLGCRITDLTLMSVYLYLEQEHNISWTQYDSYFR